MKNAGARLIQRLDEDHAEVKTAYWLYFSDDRYWRLFIVSDLVIAEGPLKYYERVYAANLQAGTDEAIVSLHDVTVMGKDTLALATLNYDLANRRLSRDRINGVFVDDAYIYRAKLQNAINNAA